MSFTGFPIMLNTELVCVFGEKICDNLKYPIYFSNKILEKFNFKDDKFFCECGSSKLYYRFDLGFECKGYIYVPTKTDISSESLLKKESPCFILVHLFCYSGCRTGWWLEGTQPRIKENPFKEPIDEKRIFRLVK